MADIDETARWTVKVSKNTDLALREHLGAFGMSERDFSGFIEAAVRWRMFDQTVQGAKDALADMTEDEIDAVVSDASTSVRDEMWPRDSKR